MRLYLAYGSNLDLGQMRHRCPGAEPVRAIMVPNRRLIFRRFADIIEEPGAQVPCAIYRITPEDEAALDRFEGVSVGSYTKATIRLRTPSLGVIQPLVYLNNRDGEDPPSRRYVETIRRGYRDWRLPMDLLDKVVMEARSKAKREAARRRREKKRQRAAEDRALLRDLDRLRQDEPQEAAQGGFRYSALLDYLDRIKAGQEAA